MMIESQPPVLTTPESFRRLRKGIAIVLATLGGLGPILLTFARELVPSHCNVGGFFWTLAHGGAALVVGGLVFCVFASLVAIARTIYPSPGIMAAAMFVAIYCPFAGWSLVDAANVWFDRLPAVTYTVKFVSFSINRKGPNSTTVTSWEGEGEEELEFYTRSEYQQPGRRLSVVVGRGALGRPYVLSLTAAEP